MILTITLLQKQVNELLLIVIRVYRLKPKRGRVRGILSNVPHCPLRLDYNFGGDNPTGIGLSIVEGDD